MNIHPPPPINSLVSALPSVQPLQDGGNPSPARLNAPHSGYDSAPARLQGGGDQIPLFQDVIASRSFSTGALWAHRQTNCVCSSYFTSSLALSAPAESETQSLSPIWLFRCYDPSVHGDQGRTSVVASAFECLEWEGTSPPISRCDNRNRRLSLRLGGGLSGSHHGGRMVPNGEKAPYKLLGTSSGFLCCQELYKGSPLCSCAVAHGQCLSGSLYQPPSGYSFPDSLQYSTSPLRMGTETQHISQCRTSIGGSECVSGLGVAPFRRLKRLQALPSDIPLIDAGQRSLRARPVRGSSERPVNPVVQLEAGSDGPSNRRPLAELGSRETIRTSSLLSYNALSGKAQRGGGANSYW